MYVLYTYTVSAGHLFLFFLFFWRHEHVLEDGISALLWRCDGPLVAHQKDVPGSILASPTMTLMHLLHNSVENLRQKEIYIFCLIS